MVRFNSPPHKGHLTEVDTKHTKFERPSSSFGTRSSGSIEGTYHHLIYRRRLVPDLLPQSPFLICILVCMIWRRSSGAAAAGRHDIGYNRLHRTSVRHLSGTSIRRQISSCSSNPTKTSEYEMQSGRARHGPISNSASGQFFIFWPCGVPPMTENLH